MLYTVARSTEDAVFDFHKTNGEQYTDFLEGIEYDLQYLLRMISTINIGLTLEETTISLTMRLLSRRLNKAYDHTTNGPK